MAEGTAVREDGARRGIPRLSVEALLPLEPVTRRVAGEGEVEAGAGGVRVGLVGGRPPGALDGGDGGGGGVGDGGEPGPPAGELRPGDPQAPPRPRPPGGRGR